MADQGIASFATGLANSINGYLGKQQDQNMEAAKESRMQSAKIAEQSANQEAETKRQLTLQQAKSNSEDILTPEMAESVLPGHGSSMVQQYNQANPGKPLKLKDGVDYLHQAAEALSPDTSKKDNHQDTLEKQATDRLTSIRGDAAISRAELQRDAAGMSYDTIIKAQNEGRPLTELEQTDLIGQLWQARTGKAPTDSDMKLLNDQTAKRGLNHMVTYLTGNPSIVGASTDDTLNNLKQFVKATGQKADSNHEAYMAPRLIKPTGLEDDRWEHIKSVNRGISFADQMTTSDKTYSSKAKSGAADVEAKRAAVRAKLGL